MNLHSVNGTIGIVFNCIELLTSYWDNELSSRAWIWRLNTHRLCVWEVCLRFPLSLPALGRSKFGMACECLPPPHFFFFFKCGSFVKIALLKTSTIFMPAETQVSCGGEVMNTGGGDTQGADSRAHAGTLAGLCRQWGRPFVKSLFYCARHLPQPCPSREKRSVVNETGQFYPFHTIVHYRLFQDRAIQSESPNADEKVLICKGASAALFLRAGGGREGTPILFFGSRCAGKFCLLELGKCTLLPTETFVSRRTPV